MNLVEEFSQEILLNDKKTANLEDNTGGNPVSPMPIIHCTMKYIVSIRYYIIELKVYAHVKYMSMCNCDIGSNGLLKC